jgi:phytoene dehydrogenase-like protein
MTEITRRGFIQGAALAPLALSPLTLPQSSTQPENRYDIVVAGAGHNSLAAACYLAKAGFRVVVLEGRPMIGGATKTAELTLAGFHSDTCSCDHNTIQSNPMLKNDELHLKDYGLEYIYPDPAYHVPFADGSSITQWNDFDRTCDEIAKHSKKDAATFRRITDESEPVKKLLRANFFTPVGLTKEKGDPLASHPQAAMWRRRSLESMWNNLHTLFENEHVMTFMMAPWPENILGPTSGMSAYTRATRTPMSPLPKGGSGMLAVALGRYLEAHGGVVLPNKAVTQLIIEGGKCVGVECADGSSYRADKAVLSTVHIKHLINLAPRKLWGDEFIEGVDSFHIGPAGFNAHYALKGPLLYAKPGGGTLMPVHSTTLSSPERAMRFDVETTVGEVDLEDPVLHAVLTTSADPSRAPKGMHVLRILGRQPWNLKDGGPEKWEEIKEKVADAHLKAVQRRAHNFTNDMILSRVITTPVDMYQMNPNAFQGCCHGGTDGPGQAGGLRPVPGWADYRMPIPGLYQTGGTTYPGFGVTAAPGRNAAWIMLKDLANTTIEEVIGKKDSNKA